MDEKYLRDLQNATAELLTAYQKLVLLEQRRNDAGIIVSPETLAIFPHLTTDNVTNAQFSVTEIKALLDNGHRANLNRIVP